MPLAPRANAHTHTRTQAPLSFCCFLLTLVLLLAASVVPQAHVNAMVNQDDFIKEAVISFSKTNVLIYELVCTEVWREKVRPILDDMGYAQESTMTPYIVVRRAHQQLQPILPCAEIYFTNPRSYTMKTLRSIVSPPPQPTNQSTNANTLARTITQSRTPTPACLLLCSNTMRPRW